MELLDLWAAWEPKEPPHVLAADRELLETRRSSDAVVTWGSWEAAYTDQAFGVPGDRRLHLGLLPMPFSGDLRRASIYILLLNPGVDPTDYYGEHVVPAFREARLANLRQDFTADRWSFVGLDPRYAWHGGFHYWHGRLRGVIAELASRSRVSYAESRHRLADRLAIIELLPYHSEAFHDADHWLGNLPSVKAARRFVRDVVLPRVLAGDAIAIVTRQAKEWDLPAVSGVTIYTRQEARAAYLTPKSPGGAAILKHLSPAF